MKTQHQIVKSTFGVVGVSGCQDVAEVSQGQLSFMSCSSLHQLHGVLVETQNS